MTTCSLFIILVVCIVSLSCRAATIDLGDLLNSGSQDCPDPCASSTVELDSPTGQVSVPIPRLRPYSNGCSVPVGLREGLGDYSHFEPCCDIHDVCYQACGIRKATCESAFRKCLKKTCQDQDDQSQCSSLADLFVMGTSMFGCTGYTELQRDACECVTDASAASERVRRYVSDFYGVYNSSHALPESVLERYSNSFGELLFRLYAKYPESIHVEKRDGESSRTTKIFF